MFGSEVIAQWSTMGIFMQSADFMLVFFTTITLVLGVCHELKLNLGSSEDIYIGLVFLFVSYCYMTFTKTAAVDWDRPKEILIAVIIAGAMSLFGLWLFFKEGQLTEK